MGATLLIPSLRVGAAVVAFAAAACSSPPPPAPRTPPLVGDTPQVIVVETRDPSTASTASAASAPSAPAPSASAAESRPGGPVACKGLALELVLDRSGSMSGLPIDMAKKAAGAAVDRLGQDDCLGVVAFDSVPAIVVPLAEVAPASMHSAIDGIAAGGGTEILPALELGHRELGRATTAKRRHLLLMTDGQSPQQGLRERVSAMKSDGITVSTIGLGGGVDMAILRSLAQTSGGRAYEVADPARLVSVFQREIDDARKR